MKTDTIHFSHENERYLQYNSRAGHNDNSLARQKMKRFLVSVMNADLTPMQKLCFTEHIMKGRQQKDIAEQLGLSCSTVCRHIAAGKKKLKHAADIYSTRSDFL